jgi:5-(carboxyamino)imidazole ribonucleotide mutase
VEVLDALGIPCEARVVSAHRTPRRLVDYAEGARDRGLKVIIAGAGGAAHLPGMAASMTALPVLGVPLPCLARAALLAALERTEGLAPVAPLPN